MRIRKLALLLSSVSVGVLATSQLESDKAQAAYFYATSQVTCVLRVPISQTGSTDVLTLTNNGYICGVFINSATAQNISLTQGTGTLCGTNPVALIGGTTASVALAANGGFVMTPPAGSYLKTTTTGQHLCLLQSGAGNVSGTILYADNS